MSWETTTAAGVRDDLPLIYLIRITAPQGEFRYVGKSSSKTRFRSAYQSNIRKIQKGQIKRNGKGNNLFRHVHLYLAVAIEHVAIENQPREMLKKREDTLTAELACNLNGNPRWSIQHYERLKSELLGGAV